MKLAGKIPAGAKVGKVAKGQYVELAREGEDTIWTVLGEFGNAINPTYGGTRRPAAQPDPAARPQRWTTRRSGRRTSARPTTRTCCSPRRRARSRCATSTSSSRRNRYTVNGDVTDWVQVPFNEANYGSNYCGGIVCARTWLFVRDSVNAWYNAQIAAGKTPAEIDAYLAQFDVWDRYDYDGDGNFNEPDGYIDHFQSVHAGEGEETGGGAQGTDAIWSHRWYAFYNNIGVTGPAFNKLGGVQIGGTQLLDRRLHRRARERRRRRLRARVRPRPRPARPVRHVAATPAAPRTRPASGRCTPAARTAAPASRRTASAPSRSTMSAYEKIFLGWSNYQVVGYGPAGLGQARPGDGQHQAGAAARRAAARQAGRHLHRRPRTPAATSTTPARATTWTTRMTRPVTLPAGAVSLAAKVRYDIELDWDYAYLTVNGDAGRDQPLDRHQPERPELRQRHHRLAPAAPGST